MQRAPVPGRIPGGAGPQGGGGVVDPRFGAPAGGGGGGGGGPQSPPGAQDDDSYSYDEEEENDEDEVPWVVWFCGLKGNEFFCEVDEEYIRDDFNLTGLSLMVPFFDNAVEMILDLDSPQDERLTEEQQRLVDSSAETLYGLIHARFILTPRGLKLMEEKYRQAVFGRCPRVACGGHPVLPVGQSDVVRESSVKLYCPRCRELYFPRSARHKALDGAFWGTSSPHLLLLTLYDGPPPVDATTNAYVPRIFGFRLRDSKAAAAAREQQFMLQARAEGGGAPIAATEQQQHQQMSATTSQPSLSPVSATAGGGAGGAKAQFLDPMSSARAGGRPATAAAGTSTAPATNSASSSSLKPPAVAAGSSTAPQLLRR